MGGAHWVMLKAATCVRGNQECQSGLPHLQGGRRGGGNGDEGCVWQILKSRCILVISFLRNITLVPLRGENILNPCPQQDLGSS